MHGESQLGSSRLTESNVVPVQKKNLIHAGLWSKMAVFENVKFSRSPAAAVTLCFPVFCFFISHVPLPWRVAGTDGSPQRPLCGKNFAVERRS